MVVLHPTHFIATCIVRNPLNLREILERFVNEQWLPVHATREEPAAIVVNQFKRTIAQALAVLEVRAAALPSDEC